MFHFNSERTKTWVWHDVSVQDQLQPQKRKRYDFSRWVDYSFDQKGSAYSKKQPCFSERSHVSFFQAHDVGYVNSTSIARKKPRMEQKNGEAQVERTNVTQDSAYKRFLFYLSLQKYFLQYYGLDCLRANQQFFRQFSFAVLDQNFPLVKDKSKKETSYRM